MKRPVKPSSEDDHSFFNRTHLGKRGTPSQRGKSKLQARKSKTEARVENLVEAFSRIKLTEPKKGTRLPTDVRRYTSAYTTVHEDYARVREAGRTFGRLGGYNVPFGGPNLPNPNRDMAREEYEQRRAQFDQKYEWLWDDMTKKDMWQFLGHDPNKLRPSPFYHINTHNHDLDQ